MSATMIEPVTDFKVFQQAIEQQFQFLQQYPLFKVNLDRDEVIETYLAAFPKGSNEVYRERTAHDCSCCKQFIRTAGGIVAITPHGIRTIWCIKDTDDATYNIVAHRMNQYVIDQINQNGISNAFLHYEKQIGTHHNFEDNGPRWDHFSIQVPNQYVVSKDQIDTKLGYTRTNQEMYLTAMNTFTKDAIATVQDLIAQNAIYRGQEFKKTVDDFKKAFVEFNKQDNSMDKYYLSWISAINSPSICRFKNSVIGTLVNDLSTNVALEDAVKMYESKVAPQNYKRTTALITSGMIKTAQAKVAELGIENALYRRHAKTDDITINNVLFANREAKQDMGVFAGLEKSTKPKSLKNLDKVQEIHIDQFVKDVLPNINSIQVMFEHKHKNNLMNLLAPMDTEVEPIFKWDNNFSWSYNGEVTDSMKQEVVKRGGKVDGVIRFTHSWNEIEPNKSLMDAHVFFPGYEPPSKGGGPSPKGRYVGWNNRQDTTSGGVQDVDYTQEAPTNFIPIENITFPNIKKMPIGDYTYKIHNWSFRHSGGKGRAEIEFDNNLYQYEYPKTKNHQWITVATVNLSKDGIFTIKHELPFLDSVKEDIWNITTNEFHTVNLLMNSPNHWDENKQGNKHWFFILDNCKNPDNARGFYNEFLKSELTPHRKVFEVLSSKTAVESSDQQLAGLGFSSTKNDSIICKLEGEFNRTIKLLF